MKKFLFSSVVLLVLNNVMSQMPTEEATRFMADVNLCKTEAGATDADVGDLYNRVLPTTKPAKCFNACVLNKLAIVNDGKFVPGNLIKVIEMDKTDLKGKDGKTLMDSMKDITTECNNISDPDKCEYAAKLRICLNAAAKKREFCPNVF